MAGEKVPLGATAYARPCAYADQQKGKMTDEQRLSVLEQQVALMLKIIFALRVKLKKEVHPVRAKAARPAVDAPHGLNKDGIPNELICIGDSEKQQFPLCMTIKQEHYEIGDRVFPSLSSAAEAVSGVRRSGWTFWKLPDGRTLKEAFKP
jgi:hypothetical protein